jgi:hypothetical protein
LGTVSSSANDGRITGVNGAILRGEAAGEGGDNRDALGREQKPDDGHNLLAGRRRVGRKREFPRGHGIDNGLGEPRVGRVKQEHVGDMALRVAADRDRDDAAVVARELDIAGKFRHDEFLEAEFLDRLVVVWLRLGVGGGRLTKGKQSEEKRQSGKLCERMPRFLIAG